MKFSKGQAMLEAVLFISIVGLGLIIGLEELFGAFKIRGEANEQAIITLNQNWLRESNGLEPFHTAEISEKYGFEGNQLYSVSTDISNDYPSANIFNGIGTALGLNADEKFPLENELNVSVATEHHDSWFHYVVVEDSWYPRKKESLTERPQMFLSTNYVAKLPIEMVQEWVSILPFAQEFGPQSLRLGWVDPDVVPKHALETEE